MTYFYELGQVVTREPELASGTLVFDGTRVPVEALLDDLQRGRTVEEFLSGHPTVFPEHVRAFVMCWEDILSNAEGPDAARRRLLAHADWALISEHVARRIDAEAGNAREPPALETLVTWTKTVVREVTGKAGTKEAEDDTADRPGEERIVMLSRLARHLDALVDRLQSDEAARAVDAALFKADTEDGVTETLHALTDAASSLRTAAGELQGRRPVHATHARRLAEDVDRLVTDLRQTRAS